MLTRAFCSGVIPSPFVRHSRACKGKKMANLLDNSASIARAECANSYYFCSNGSSAWLGAGYCRACAAGAATNRQAWQPCQSVFLQPRKDFAELGHLGRGHGHAVTLVRVALEEILVVVLGRPVIFERQQLDDDEFAKQLVLAHLANDVVGRCFLLGCGNILNK